MMLECQCCPYGYHIDLDFVRYCEGLAKSVPSDGQRQRRDRRRQRKSMEVMLGFEQIVQLQQQLQQPPLQEVAYEYEPPSPAAASCRTNSYSNFDYNNLRNGAETVDHCNNYNNNRHSNNSNQETYEFVRHVLDDVCDDFERNLQRANKPTTANISIYDNDNSSHHHQNTHERVATDENLNNYSLELSESANEIYESGRAGGDGFYRRSLEYDSLSDACISSNKPSSPITKNVNYLQQHQRPRKKSPSPPTQITSSSSSANNNDKNNIFKQNKDHSSWDDGRTFSEDGSVNGNSAAKEREAATAAANDTALQNIREQMVISLRRMRDLEDQVKLVPMLQQQLIELQDEKRQLNKKIQKTEEINRQLIIKTTTMPSLNNFSDNNNLNNKLNEKLQQFKPPQRISPVLLDTIKNVQLNNKKTTNNCDENDNRKPIAITKRDIGIGTKQIINRCIGTTTKQLQQHTVGNQTDWKMYSKAELEAAIDLTIEKQKYERKRSIGTQMTTPPPPPIKEDEKIPIIVKNNVSVQTNTLPEPIIPQRPQQQSMGTMTPNPPIKLDKSISCQPQQRSVGCSDSSIDEELCKKCSVKKRSIAVGSSVPYLTRTASPLLPESPKESLSLSLKALDAIPTQKRSLTFSLGDSEKLQLKRKTVGVQCDDLLPPTLKPVRKINKQTQSTIVSCDNQQTDTIGLIKLCSKSIATERIEQKSMQIGTEKLRTHEQGVNTQQAQMKNVGCGGTIRPHISISCADNYCDQCKDAIKNLAKDFTQKEPEDIVAENSTSFTRAITPTTPTSIGADFTSLTSGGSRIPRPKTLQSPRPDRKILQRQNTYTIPSPTTPTAAFDKKTTPPPLSPVVATQSLFDGDSTTQSVFRLSALQQRQFSSENLYSSKSSVAAPASVNPPTKELLQSRDDFQHKTEHLFSQHVDITTNSSLDENMTNSTNEPTIIQEVQATVAAEVATTSISAIASSSSTDQPQSPLNLAKENDLDQIIIKKSVPLQNTDIGTGHQLNRKKTIPNKEMLAALKVINDSIQKNAGSTMPTSNTKSANRIVQKEWFKLSSTDHADPLDVEDYLDCFEEFSSVLLRFMVNLSDTNGNTAMHYAVSHGNFDVVSILLDSKVCHVNQMNNAGYTCVMLVSLAKLKISEHNTVVRRLFQMSDVNVRAKKHYQTALMLAVSHGNFDMVQMLLEAGADINIQDEDGSTALMCAAEHGRIDIVKLLLAQSDCDSTIQDVDGSTALKISLEAGFRDIGVLLYAHEHITRTKTSPYTSLRRTKKKSSKSSTPQLQPQTQSLSTTPTSTTTSHHQSQK